jgi:hypothetical protein
MHSAPLQPFENWRLRVLASFRRAQWLFTRTNSNQEQSTQLHPVKGKLNSKAGQLKSYFEKYTFLVVDKSRGNFVLVCNNLFKMKCVQTLSRADDYQRVHNTTADVVITRISQNLVGLLNHRHTDMLKESLPYFYLLPKLHKQPIGWRPVAVCQGSISEIPHRLLAQCLRVVSDT